MIEQIFASEDPKVPLFRLAFRAFFLSGAIFSVVVIGLWLLTLNGQINLSLYGGTLFWHIHEMIYGFVAAIVVGFLLTAVQTWTGVKSVNGLPLFCLFLCWLLARVGFVFSDALNPIFLAGLDIAFMLMAALFLSIPLIKVKQTRNLFFVPVLLLFALCNGMMHVGLINNAHDLVVQGSRSALLLVAVLMVVIGGRVIPMFTANGTNTPRVPNIAWLDKAALISVWLLMLLFLIGVSVNLPASLLGGVFILAGSLNVLRCVRWRFWVTLRTALVWPLHLAYGFIGLAFIMLGKDLILTGQSSSSSWHLLTVGGMGMLILAMISRVSLGHTGRPLKAPIWMLPAFILLLASVVLRSIFPAVFVEKTLWWFNLSGGAWIVAYSCFAIGYFYILTRPRIDKKPG